MKNFLHGCSQAIAVILAILFVITAVIVLLLFNVERGLLRPGLYKAAMVEHELYERLPGLLAKQLHGSMTYNPCEEDPSLCEGEGPPGEGEGEGEGDGGPPEFFTNLSEDDWEKLIDGIIPKDWLRTQVEGVLDQVFALLETGDVESGVVISMVGLKQHLAGEEGMQAILELIQAQPPCTEDQLLMLSQLEIDMSSVSTLLTCSPPQEILDMFLPNLRPILDEITGGIKDETNLLETLGEGGDLNIDFQAIGMVRLIIRLSPLLPLVLLLLVTLFGVRSLKGFFLWWGIPLLVVGVIGFSGSLMVPFLVNWAISMYGSAALPGGFSPDFLTLGFDLVRFVLGSLARAIGRQTAISGIVGLGFVIASFFIKPREPVEASSVP
jgi:hypothetical protein